MSSPVISVESLSKAYRIGVKEEVPDTLVQAATGWMKAPLKNFSRLRKLNTFGKGKGEEDDILWALKDVSFDVQEGEVVGIIGRNGAGKSTLLKILSRITEPTSGRVVLRGRVSSLLEVGTGFHPELTGRENIYMNGTILGMTKREIDRKFDEIVDFSGVEKFLDTPVKRYSSGMKVRLAFAVAAHLEPEILIVDEVLAVGDGEFQKKCLGKMQDVAQGGRTVLFVSHNMPAVRSLTSKGAFLKSGELNYFGETESTIDEYLSDCTAESVQEGNDLEYFRRNPSSESPIRVDSIGMDAEKAGDRIPRVPSGGLIKFCLSVQVSEYIEQLCISITLIRNHEDVVTTLYSADNARGYFSLDVGLHNVTCEIDNLPLSPGVYSINLGLNRNAVSTAYDCILDYPIVEIFCPEIDNGQFDWPHRPWGAIVSKNSTWSIG